jgi:hypothetical protein
MLDRISIRQQALAYQAIKSSPLPQTSGIAEKNHSAEEQEEGIDSSFLCKAGYTLPLCENVVYQKL